MSDIQRDAPPVGEELHLPGPSIIPFAMAIAITLVVIGTTINWFITGFGLILFVILLIRWIGDTRPDIGELPDQHVH